MLRTIPIPIAVAKKSATSQANLITCHPSASSDQLSHLNRCFDLLSFFHFPPDSIRVSSLYCFSHNVLSPALQNLFIIRCVVSSIVFVLPYQFLFTYIVPSSRFAFHASFPCPPLCSHRSESCCTPLLMPVCANYVLSACRVNKCFNHICHQTKAGHECPIFPVGERESECCCCVVAYTVESRLAQW